MMRSGGAGDAKTSASGWASTSTSGFYEHRLGIYERAKASAKPSASSAPSSSLSSSNVAAKPVKKSNDKKPSTRFNNLQLQNKHYEKKKHESANNAATNEAAVVPTAVPKSGAPRLASSGAPSVAPPQAVPGPKVFLGDQLSKRYQRVMSKLHQRYLADFLGQKGRRLSAAMAEYRAAAQHFRRIVGAVAVGDAPENGGAEGGAGGDQRSEEPRGVVVLSQQEALRGCVAAKEPKSIIKKQSFKKNENGFKSLNEGETVWHDNQYDEMCMMCTVFCFKHIFRFGDGISDGEVLNLCTIIIHNKLANFDLCRGVKQTL